MPNLLTILTRAEIIWDMALRRMTRRRLTPFQNMKDLAYPDRYTLPRTEDRDVARV
jgi:hypothetical protein